MFEHHSLAEAGTFCLHARTLSTDLAALGSASKSV